MARLLWALIGDIERDDSFAFGSSSSGFITPTRVAKRRVDKEIEISL